MFLKFLAFLVFLTFIRKHNAFSQTSFLVYLEKQPSKLKVYNNFFGNVHLARYLVPEDTRVAVWKLEINILKDCSSTNLFFFLEHNAYPKVLIKNETVTLNSNYLAKHKSFTHVIEKMNPLSGFWYSASFLDTNYNSNCSINLNTSVNYIRLENVAILTKNMTFFTGKSSLLNFYKYFYKEYDKSCLLIEIEFLNVTSLRKTNCTSSVFIRESAFPNSNTFNNEYVIWRNDSDSICKIKLVNPLKNKWYYLLIKSEHAISVTTKTEEKNQLMPQFKRIFKAFRQIKASQTTFLFNKISSAKTNELLLESELPYAIKFHTNENELGSVINIKIINPVIQYFSSVENFPIDQSILNNETVTILMHVCLLTEVSIDLIKSCSHTESGLAFEFRSFKKNNKQQVFVMDRSKINKTMLSAIFPRAGPWALIFRKECFSLSGKVTKCKSINQIKSERIDIEIKQCVRFSCDKYGECLFNQSNNAQVCECSNDKNLCKIANINNFKSVFKTKEIQSLYTAPINYSSLLFLTLSNLGFILPIILAIYRRLYIEALVYFHNMFYSAFYHACDNQNALCIFNYDSLQIADFFSSYSSIVITLLSISAFDRSFKVFFFILGIFVCLSVVLVDRFNLIGIIVIMVLFGTLTVTSWVKTCCTTKKVYPRIKQILFFIPGIVLAIVGLLCFTVFSTLNNYWIVHSIWHLCISISIIFFLPFRKKNNKIHPETLREDASTQTIKDFDDQKNEENRLVYDGNNNNKSDDNRNIYIETNDNESFTSCEFVPGRPKENLEVTNSLENLKTTQNIKNQQSNSPDLSDSIEQSP